VVCGEADQLLMEIFVMGSYPVDLSTAMDAAAARDKPAVTVLDVGANVGLFALFIQQQHRQLCGKGGTKAPPLALHCFEPLPPVSHVLRDVASQVSAHCPSTTMHCHEYACGSAGGTDTFTYFRDSPAESTRWPQERAAQQAALWDSAKQRQRVLQSNLDGEREGAACKRRRIEPGLELRALDLFVGGDSCNGAAEELPTTVIVAEHSGHDAGTPAAECEGGSSQHACCVRTLAEVMQEEGITFVDLLKVDAEGDELNVLLGISCGGWDGWPLIEEVLVEVHDVDGRLQKVLDLLQHSGKFLHVDAVLASTWVTREVHCSPISGLECAGYVSFLPSSLKLYMVHAKRQPPAHDPGGT
jgi:FkbM family methyltransferase